MTRLWTALALTAVLALFGGEARAAHDAEAERQTHENYLACLVASERLGFSHDSAIKRCEPIEQGPGSLLPKEQGR
jgi:hypothetical protein